MTRRSPEESLEIFDRIVLQIGTHKGMNDEGLSMKLAIPEVTSVFWENLYFNWFLRAKHEKLK